MDRDPFGLLGVVLDGKFRVDELVGEGELSVIYRGYHLGVDTPVAIKCLHLPDTLDPALTRPVVEAFEDAGRLDERLGRANPHVAQAIAIGRTVAPRTGATVPYRVREWFEGQSLASELARRRRQGDKPRTVEETFALLAPAIDGIAHAHEEGIAHLTLDPGNLFLARVGGACSLKVLNFGSVRTRHQADARPTLDSEVTRGLRLLHPAYAAPEQLDMDLGEPGPWSDVYALALIMMEVLAERSDVGRGETAALVRRALDKQKRPTPETYGLKLPRALDAVLTRAVARNRESRQKNARVFLNELKAAVGQGAGAKAAPARVAPTRVAPLAPSKAAKPAPPPKAPPAPAPAPAIVAAPMVFVASVPLAPPTPQPEASPPLPSAAASGPLAVVTGAEEPPPAPAASPPSVLRMPAVPLPALLGEEEKVVRRGASSRALLRLRLGAAALAIAGVLAGIFALARVHRPSERAGAARAPSAAAAVVRPATAPVGPPAAAPVPAFAATPVVPAVAALTAPPSVASTEQAANPRSAARASIVRFSPTAAQHAVHSVNRRIERCRHGRFWGNGYATVVFWNDGSIHQVLVDPPFSMTVTGKCVADALRTAHVRSFAGRYGYYRFHFYIAPR